MVKKYLYRKAYEYVRKINRMSKEKQKGFKAFKSEGKQYDLTDVFKGKNIKNPKTFLKERKKLIEKMTGGKKGRAERKQELYDEWVEDNVRKHGGDPGDIPEFSRGGKVLEGIRKAAELKKKMVKAREETLRKSPKGSRIRKIIKQFEEHRKLKKYGKGGRVKRGLKLLGWDEKAQKFIDRSPGEIKKGVEGWAKRKYGVSYKKLREKKREMAEKIENLKAGEGWSRKTPRASKKELLPDAPYFKKGGAVKYAKGGRAGAKGTQSGEAKRKMSTARMKAKNRRDKIKEILKGEVPLHHMREQIKDIKYGRKFHKGGTVKRKPNKDRYDKGGAVKKRVGQVVQKVKRVAGHLKKVMEKPEKVRYLPAKKMQEGGEVKGDSEYLDSQLSMDYAKSILDIARKRKPSGVINQDDINAAKEEFNRKRATKEAAPNIPMPKTSKRSLVKPMQKSEPNYTPGPGYFADDPSRGLPEAGPARRRGQDRFTMDEGMVIKPTDEYVGKGFAKGGSVSSKPKQRGWGKAIKGTKFKGTF